MKNIIEEYATSLIITAFATGIIACMLLLLDTLSQM